jgi:hypothetical protein
MKKMRQSSHLIPVAGAVTMFAAILIAAGGCASPGGNAPVQNQPGERMVRLQHLYDAAVCVTNGAFKANAGDMDGAILDFTRAIELEPNYVVAYAARGYAEQKKGDWDGAISDCSQAISIKQENDKRIAELTHNKFVMPRQVNDAFPYLVRGDAKQAKGSMDEAKADYQQASELNTNLSVARGNNGIDVAAASGLDSAFKNYTKAVNPNSILERMARYNTNTPNGNASYYNANATFNVPVMPVNTGVFNTAPTIHYTGSGVGAIQAGLMNNMGHR